MSALVLGLDEARTWRRNLRREGRTLVFTNGVFDLLHAGHVEYLQAARAFGDALLVGVNGDASVRRLAKGADRPLCPLEDRLLVLAGLRAVDALLPFDEDTPLALIEALEPDVLVKGADYALAAIVGAAETLGRGGRVERIPLREGRSTSALLQRIRARSGGTPGSPR
jgi:rfaE bifunctional protein nucleotidyltransferase chain/domain